MKAISFDSRICRDLNQALKKEWRETSNLGLTASSTVTCTNTSSAHGFLAGSRLLFNNLDETLFIDDVPHPLSTRVYEHTVFPDGFRHLSEFHLLPFPSWMFKIGDVVLMKSIFMVHGEESVFVRYQLLGGNEVLTRLEVKPLIVERPPRSLSHRRPDFKPVLTTKLGRIGLACDGKPPDLFFYHNAAIVEKTSVWYERVHYPVDCLKGSDFEEDLYVPFALNYTFLRGLEVFLCVSTREKKEFHPELVISAEEESRRKLAPQVTLSTLQ